MTPTEGTAVIATWTRAKRHLQDAQAKEMAARLAVGRHFHILDPTVEGSRTVTMEGIPKFTWKQPFNYKLDPVVLETMVVPALRDMDVNVDELFKYTPTLVLKPYRGLSQQAVLVLSNALEVTPGTPQLEIGKTAH